MGSRHSAPVPTPTDVEVFVDNLLKNKKVNSSYVFDPVERRLYINVVTFLVEGCAEFLKNVELKVLDKRVRITVEPYDNNDTTTQEESQDEETKVQEIIPPTHVIQDESDENQKG
jgi:hypothetical protein